MSGGVLMPGHAPLGDHPLAGIFPLLAEPELRELADDIAAHGQRETVKLHSGLILDGRNRYRACALAGKPVRYETFAGSNLEALRYVVSKNLRRRHLNESQRATVAAKLATLKLGDNQHSPAPIGAPSLPLDDAPQEAAAAAVSQSEAADLLNVGRRSVQRAAVVLEKGAPELQQAVEAGDIAVSAAADIAELPLDEQKKIIAQASPEAIKEVAKEKRTERQRENREARLAKGQAPRGGPMPQRKYNVLYVDVPREWVSWSEETGLDKAPEYRTEAFDYLAGEFAVQLRERAAKDCVLFMHAWPCSLIDQLDLMAEWGFARMRRRDQLGMLMRAPDGKLLPPAGEGRYRTHLVWAKRPKSFDAASRTTLDDAASRAVGYHVGPGFWFRDVHSLVLVGARGDVPCVLQGENALSILDAPWRGHSVQPEEIRDLIDRYFPTWPKLELFARVGDLAAFQARWPTWDAWGNEIDFAPAQQALALSSPDWSGASRAIRGGAGGGGMSYVRLGRERLFIELPIDVITRLDEEARHRGIVRASQMAQQILETVCRQNLFMAVLDVERAAE